MSQSHGAGRFRRRRPRLLGGQPDASQNGGASIQKFQAASRSLHPRHPRGNKIPWGVDSDQFWGQTEVANQLNLEATNATRSPLRRTDRYPNQSWRNFRVSLELSRSTWLITSLFLIFPRVSSPTNASAPTGDAKMSGCGARTAGGLSRVS
jgi:hypothetical protein